MESDLSEAERGALLDLGRDGAGGDFDELALSKLFTKGLVEVRSIDRRLTLTKAGQYAYQRLQTPPMSRLQ